MDIQVVWKVLMWCSIINIVILWIWSLMMLVVYVGYGAATIAVLLTSGVARTYQRRR